VRGSQPVSDLVALWLDYAERNKRQVAVDRANDDDFGAQLSLARAEVRATAAELLAASATPAEAAVEMHRRATTHWVRELPIIGFDTAAVAYTKARIWQDCARAIDPSLVEVQPLLTWE
jgi:hypothetical protein